MFIIDSYQDCVMLLCSSLKSYVVAVVVAVVDIFSTYILVYVYNNVDENEHDENYGDIDDYDDPTSVS